jgi:hypothetical protein
LRTLGAIVAKVNDEYPNLRTIIGKIDQSIQTRLNNEEEQSYDKF